MVPVVHFQYLAQLGVPESITSLVERLIERPWAALVEMLLIGTVVYAVLRFLQGTRGARLVRAVLIILAVSFMIVWLIAERFGFERINVLYPYFMLGVFLASLVAFQTELRRMLIRLGQGGWLRHWIKGTSEPIEPIVTAVERLAKKKIGALIAIERSTELGGLIETGIELDATVSAELIENIFWPGAPLHDLGMIIHDGRIRAAGCQFPLAETGDLDRSLGSRHRAAVGMSAEVEVILDRHHDVLTVPVAAVLETELGAFCWVRTANGPKRRVLQLGASNDSFIVVEAGLKQGEAVVLNVLAFMDEAQDEVSKPLDNAEPRRPLKTEIGDVN